MLQMNNISVKIISGTFVAAKLKLNNNKNTIATTESTQKLL